MSLLIVNTLSIEVALPAIEKLKAHYPDLHVINTDNLNIHPCIGCNTCWLKTPGICVLKDDYEEILKAYLNYDEVIFLSGTALGFVNHQMKNLIDRLLPLGTMYIHIVDNQCRHVPRYHKKYRFGLLYVGEANQEYLNLWMNKVMINFGGVSLGAYPFDKIDEVISCIL